MRLYAEDTTDNLINRIHHEIAELIERETESYILNVGENQYIEHLIGKYILELPVIDFENVYVDTYEKDIPGNQFPMEFMIYDKAKYIKRNVIVYHIPFTGDIKLLRFRPNTYLLSAGADLQIETNTIRIELINFYDDPERIKSAYNEKTRIIVGCYQYLKNDIDTYNASLEIYIKSTLQKRRQVLLKKNNFLASLGVPIKQNSTISKTYAIPKPVLREKISIKPMVYNTSFKPEPTIDNDTYFKILKIINDVGKNFERLPSVYAHKKEEDLRDHILSTLDPNFELGSASGETFNKSGKTDILLRYDSSVVFVAECKFWSGEKNFLETIDQLLGYLTWRESKTSVIIFVKNKDMTSVIETTKAATKKHNCFIREKPSNDISWFNYIFSLPTDKNKELQLAVQLFHIP